MAGDKLRADVEASIAFLRQWEPEGPWVLTAIAPERKGIQTVSFEPTMQNLIRKWLQSHEGKWNVYFSVNRVKKGLAKKAEKSDVLEVPWLHVDVDPREPGAGKTQEEKEEHNAAERERILKMLRVPPNDVPSPTCIVYSGGGYQAFWRLEEPVKLDKPEDAELIERYNIQLELAFGADPCHNVDRVMRLPGTLNVPDRKKIAKGRMLALATLVEWAGATYPLSAFKPAPPVQSSSGGTAGAPPPAKPQVQVDEVERLPDVYAIDDHAEKPIADWCKVLIVQGDDPDDPQKYRSRSEALFAACCEMIRCGVSDQVIYNVITDPDFLISASVLDKGRAAQKYALRQIERAKEEGINPHLRELNERFAVIGNMGGRCRVVEELYDDGLKRSRLTKQSFEDFRNRYMHQRVCIGTDQSGKEQFAPLGKWWLAHEGRRQFDRIAFVPGKEVPEAYNLWRGFSCEPLPGNGHEIFLVHVRNVICSGNEEHYEWLVNWMAHCVQFPAQPGHVAIVLRGVRGAGKSKFAHVFGRLWGRHFLHVSDPKHLVGSFNAHLRDCVILFGDEAFFAGDKKHESVLKTLITEDLITVEAKGVDAEVAQNYIHMILASNNDWVIPAGADERRFFVLDVADAHKQDTKYFGQLEKQLKDGGLSNLLHFLMERDVTAWDPRKAPTTAALQEQKTLSFSPEEEWWHSRLREGTLLRREDHWADFAPSDTLLDEYLRYTQKVGTMRRATATAFGTFLRKALPPGFPRRKRRSVETDEYGHNGEPPKRVTRRQYVYEFPKLEECRDHWDKKFGEKFDWHVEEEKEPY